MRTRAKISVIVKMEVMKVELDKRVREEEVIRWWASGKGIGTV